MTKLKYWLPVIIFVVALGLKSARLNAPPIDAHPQRQTDTACTIYFFANVNLNILLPRTCLIRPVTNLEGFFLLEFPAYQWLAAMAQIISGFQGLWVVRLVNLALFAGAFWCLYYGCRNYFSARMATLAVFVFSWLPSGMFFFGQAIHPDVFMVAALFASWFCLTLYLKNNQRRYFWGTLACLVLAIATRPFVAICLPAWALLAWQHKKYRLIPALVLALLPYLAWMYGQTFFPAASHAWQQWTFGGQEKLLELETWKLLIWKNVMGEVMGKVVSVLAGLAVVVAWGRKKLKPYLFVLVYLLMVPVYWLLVPEGNLIHQYYGHVYIFPVIILAAALLDELWQVVKRPWLRMAVVGGACCLVMLNGYRTSRYFYLTRIAEGERELAAEIAENVPAGSRVLYLGQTSFSLALAYRQGWVVAPNGVDVSKDLAAVMAVLRHADYVVAPSFDGIVPVENLPAARLSPIAEKEAGKIYLVK